MVAGPPSAIGSYDLLSVIGSGGMGDVYRARDRRSGEDCALKVLRLEGDNLEERIRRFENEVAAIRTLDHPGIVAVRDAGSEGSYHYLAMELVEGRTLDAWLVEDERPFYQRLRMLHRVCLAVDHAHQHGLIHRDLKPGNILMRAGDDRPVVADFGLARAIGSDSSLTRSEDAVGTPAYMAPEQARGEHRRCDARTDVWALGVIGYQAVVGARPFQGETSLDVMAAIVTRDPPAPRQINPSVPRALERVLMQCLRKPMAQRYATAGELAADLDNVLAGRSVRARSYGWRQRHQATLRRLALPLSLVAALLVAALGFGAFLVADHYRRIGEWQPVWSWRAGETLAPGAIEAVHDDWDDPQPVVPGDDGLLRPEPHHLLWLAAVEERGPVRLSARLRWIEAIDGLELLVHASRQHDGNWAMMPSGYGAQVGGFRNSQHLLSFNRRPQQPDRGHAVPSQLVPGRWYQVALAFDHEHVRLSVDGRVVIDRPVVLPLGDGTHYAVGLRSWEQTPLEIAALRVERRALPRQASPLVAPDALLVNGLSDAARRDYVALADAYRGTAIAERALSRAAILAYRAGDLVAADALAARLLRSFPDSALRQGVDEQAALAAYEAGDHALARTRIEAVYREWPRSRLATRLLQARPGRLPPELVDPILRGVARSGQLALDLRDFRGVERLDALAGGELQILIAEDNPVSSLDPVAAMPLRDLWAAGCRLTSLPTWSRSTLQNVNLSHNRIASLASLRGQPLVQLLAPDNPIEDLSPLAGSPLEVLDLNRTGVADLSPLVGLPLRVLRLEQTAVRDCAALAGMSLEELDLDHTAITDLSPLAGMPLRRVELRGTGVTALEPIVSPALRELSLGEMPLGDLSPLRTAPVTVLEIEGQPALDPATLPHATIKRLVAERCGLRGMPAGEWPRLRELDCSGNPLGEETDFSALERLEILALADCGLRRVPPLPPGLKAVDLQGDNPLEDVDALLALAEPPEHCLLPWERMAPALIDRLIAAWSHGGDPELLRALRIQRALAAGDRAALLREGEHRDGRTYVAVDRRLTWPQAQALAADYGARLLTLRDDPGLADLLVRLIDGRNLWLGARLEDDRWHWSDGRPIDPARLDRIEQYRWRSGLQPDALNIYLKRGYPVEVFERAADEGAGLILEWDAG